MNLTFAVRTRLVAGIVRGESPGDCWRWVGRKHRQGYGLILNNDVDGQHNYLAHRVSFAVANGYIPTLHILHSCDNPECCNPLHLREGTNLDNVQDRVARSRSNTVSGESNGMSKLTEAQVIEIYKLKYRANQVHLARKYKIDKAIIYNIWNKKCWVAITDPIDVSNAAAWELLKQSLPKITRS